MKVKNCIRFNWIAGLLSLLSIATSIHAEQHGLVDGAPQFKVGVIAPLTGALAEYGLAAKNGMELAQIQHPDVFSNIRFFYEDSQWDAKSAVSAFNNLRSTKKVSLVFNWGNPTSEAVAPIAERFSMPLLGMTLDARVARGKNFFIRSTNPAEDFSKVLADYLEKKGYHKIGVVMAENTYVQGLLEGLKSQLSSDQSIEVVAQHNMSDTDFRSTVSKTKQKRYDALGVFLISGQVSAFYRQLMEQKVSIPTFGTDFFESSTEIKLAQGGMEGAVYPHLAVTKKFESEYVARFGNDYQLAYAGNAYDMAILIGTLFNSDGSGMSNIEIMEKLKGSEAGLEGVAGAFHYSHSDDGDSYYRFPVRLKLIQGETFHVLK